MTTTSASSSSLCALTKLSRFAEPTSSSPSRMTSDVDRQLAVLLQVRLDGLEVHEDLALVVGRAARVDLAVAHGGFERRRLPQLDRIDRLHVVVAVEEDRRRPFGAQPVAVDDGKAGRLDQPHVLHADAPHLVGRPLGAALHVAGMLGQRADARDGEVRLELLDVTVAVGVDEVDDVVHVWIDFYWSEVQGCERSTGRRLRLDRQILPGRPIPSTSRCSCGPADSRAGAARGSRARRGSRPGSR